MWRPALEYDEGLVTNPTRHLGQHALLARLDHFPVCQTKIWILDGIEHQLIGARFDAVHLLFELVGEGFQIREILDARFPDVVGNGKGVFCPLKIGSHGLDRTVLPVRLVVGDHSRIPVAEKDVEILAAQARIDDVDAEKLAFRLISKRLQQAQPDAGRKGQVIPAGLRQPHAFACLRITGKAGTCGRQQSSGKYQALQMQHRDPHNCPSGLQIDPRVSN
ncbi:hypothetical protein BKP54_13810 [Ensifer sp. 1H6]|nr:hypothetical protein BKP54_13810 [Ensifer sp. 1H6]